MLPPASFAPRQQSRPMRAAKIDSRPCRASAVILLAAFPTNLRQKRTARKGEYTPTGGGTPFHSRFSDFFFCASFFSAAFESTGF